MLLNALFYELIEKIKIEVESFKLSDDLIEIYDLEIRFDENYDYINQKNTIGKWLDDNPNEFFAKSSYARVRKDRYTNPFGSLQASILTLGSVNENEYERIRNGFEIEVEVPYKAVVFTMNSKFPNVESYTCRMIFLLSKRLIRFFYFITNYEEKNWDEKTLNSKFEWFSSEHFINDKQSIFDGLKKIFSEFEMKARKELDDKFNKQETQ